jgi:hypothetical protein
MARFLRILVALRACRLSSISSTCTSRTTKRRNTPHCGEEEGIERVRRVRVLCAARAVCCV